MKAKQIGILWIVLAVTACGADDGELAAFEMGEIDEALVGTWSGAFIGNDGSSNTVEIVLHSQGIGQRTPSGACLQEGDWGVSGDSFRMLVVEQCGPGRWLTFTATRNEDVLVGHYREEGGRGGSFRWTKQ